jgi:nucleotide-binding universal stress UspA family protein
MLVELKGHSSFISQERSIMQEIQRILAATDFSERSARAEKRAAMLCVELGVEKLDLLTVIHPQAPATLAHAIGGKHWTAKAMLTERALRGLKHIAGGLLDEFGIRCDYGVRFGQPATEIIAHAHDLQADLIVFGANGCHFVSEFFLGSSAEQLARMSKRPILIVKNEPREPYREVLMPIGFSGGAASPAKAVRQISPSAHVTFLHVYELWIEGRARRAGVDEDLIDAYRVKAANDAKHRLDEFISNFASNLPHVSRIVERGSPVPVIGAYAKTMNPDLIVLGKYRASLLEELLLGSVARSTISQSACDVLVAPKAIRAKRREDPGLMRGKTQRYESHKEFNDVTVRMFHRG